MTNVNCEGRDLSAVARSAKVEEREGPEGSKIVNAFIQ